MAPAFQLRFDPSQIDHWASRYCAASDYADEEELIGTVPPRVLEAGFLTRDDLLELALWKSKRRAKKDVPRNEEGFVQEVTRIALSTPEERLRIEVLRLLDGVEWPTASVILHLCHDDPYPILDFRALWSASGPVPNAYTFQFWEAYTAFCREVAQNAGVSMRQLDRAMWQYSKEHQPTHV